MFATGAQFVTTPTIGINCHSQHSLVFKQYFSAIAAEKVELLRSLRQEYTLR